MNRSQYLITTGIDHKCELPERVILMGPWCLLGEASTTLRQKEFTVLSTPWTSADDVTQAADYCQSVYEALLPKLAQNLNRIHGVSYSDKYWKILLGSWLLHFINVLYDRFTRMELAMKCYPQFKTQVLPIVKCALAVPDTLAFIDESLNDIYNFHLISLLAHALCPHHVLEIDNKLVPKKPKANQTPRLKRLFFKTREFLFKFLSFGRVWFVNMYRLSLLDMLKIKLALGITKVGFLSPGFFPLNDTLLSANPDLSLRKQIVLVDAEDKFQKILYDLVPQALPTCYLEDYTLYHKTARSIRKIEAVKYIGSAVGYLANEGLKYLVAEAVALGAKSIEFQHGGGYGTARAMPLEKLSLERDRFYTWGWTAKQKDWVKPLPNPYLSKYEGAHRARLAKLLFVGIAMPKYVYRFHTELMPEDMSQYFSQKVNFFNYLPDKIKKIVWYRPYRKDYGWDEVKLIKRACPGANVLQGGKLIESMKKANLVVIDHPHTSYIEALVLNVPTILFWDHTVFAMREDAERYFQILREAGILFKSAKAAARKAVEVMEDPIGWWQAERVQAARKQFLDNYGYTSRVWLKNWATEFAEV